MHFTTMYIMYKHALITNKECLFTLCIICKCFTSIFAQFNRDKKKNGLNIFYVYVWIKREI